MIRLNCGLIAETEENRRKAIALAKELVELSLHDAGCVEYDLLGSLTNTDRLMIYETWQDEASLKAHMASDHFRRLVPEIEKVAALTLEKFPF
jgi:antibiotic biosynthesis monooxygenase subfamily